MQLPKYRFVEESDEFMGMIVGGVGLKEPIELDVALGDFESFLKAFLPRCVQHIYAIYEKAADISRASAVYDDRPALTKDEWVSILKLSTKWLFNDLRKFAISHLSSIEMDSIDRICLGKQFRVCNWLLEGYEQVVERLIDLIPSPIRSKQTLTAQEGRKIGLEVALELSGIAIRHLRGSHPNLTSDILDSFEEEFLCVQQDESRFRTRTERLKVDADAKATAAGKKLRPKKRANRSAKEDDQSLRQKQADEAEITVLAVEIAPPVDENNPKDSKDKVAQVSDIVLVQPSGEEEIKTLKAEIAHRLEEEEQRKREERPTEIKDREDREANAFAKEKVQEEETARKLQEGAEANRLAEEAEAKCLEDEIAAREAEAQRFAAYTEARRLAEESEAKRLADEIEAKRLADEAEAKCLADEIEAKRLADEVEAEAKRWGEEAEAKHLTEEAEAKRLAEEAERLVNETEAKRFADQAAAARLAEAKWLADEAQAARLAAECAEAERVDEAKRKEQEEADCLAQEWAKQEEEEAKSAGKSARGGPKDVDDGEVKLSKIQMKKKKKNIKKNTAKDHDKESLQDVAATLTKYSRLIDLGPPVEDIATVAPKPQSPLVVAPTPIPGSLFDEPQQTPKGKKRARPVVVDSDLSDAYQSASGPPTPTPDLQEFKHESAPDAPAKGANSFQNANQQPQFPRPLSIWNARGPMLPQDGRMTPAPRFASRNSLQERFAGTAAKVTKSLNSGHNSSNPGQKKEGSAWGSWF